jgi:hypothetical protein
MKKTFFILIIIGLMLTVSSCQRTDVADPSWDGPAGFYILLEGSASPAVLEINGINNSMSTINVRVTYSNGAPIANATIFFEQLSDDYGHVAWGYFENNSATIKKVTNANGQVSVAFFSPVIFYSHNMYIHAFLQVNGRAYSYAGIPQDYIALALVQSGTAAAVSEK